MYFKFIDSRLLSVSDKNVTFI